MTERRKSEVKDLAARFADEAVEVLATLMRESSSQQVRVTAARELLDRAHGKPKAESAEGERGPTYEELIQRSYKPGQP